MSLTFDFFHFSTFTLLRLGVDVIIYCFFVLGIYHLRKKELIKYSDSLFIISIIVLCYSISLFFIPAVRVEGQWTWPDLQYGFSYDFTVFRSIPASLNIILGISMIITGMKNQLVNRMLFQLSGVILILRASLDFFNYSFFYYTAWFYSQNLSGYIPTFNTLLTITLLVQALYFLTFLAFSFKSKQRYFILYCLASLFGTALFQIM
jgi:hypothetical protein